MNSVKRLRHAIVLCALLLVSGAARDAVLRAQQSAASSAAAVVKPHTYVSLDPVPRGKEFQVAVVVDINEAYHMNSHKPLDSYLIPTTLTPQLPAGFKLIDTVYPNGQDKRFPFSPEKPLNVYSGKVTLRMRLSAGENAPIGTTALPIALRYQACNTSTCLPPVKMPVNAEVRVSAAGSKGRALHPEIFSATSSPRK
jgi:Thiol:disulfide interchange protein DsbD, N-terminal